MNKFTCVLLLGTALLAGCVDREGYYNSVREEDSHGLTSLRGQPELRYNDDWSRWPRVYGATALYPLYASAYYELVPEPKDKDRTSLAWQAYGLQQTRTAEAYDSLIKGTATVILLHNRRKDRKNVQKKQVLNSNIPLSPAKPLSLSLISKTRLIHLANSRSKTFLAVK